MRIVYVGYKIEQVYQNVMNGKYSPFTLYGGVELSKLGYDVKYCTMSHNNIWGSICDISKIIKLKPDFVFFPFIYINSVMNLLLLFAKILCLYRIKTCGVLHYTPKNKLSYRLIFSFVFSKVYFHSPKNMSECIADNIIDKSKCELLNWGADISYLDKLEFEEVCEDNRYFISTGLENRDLDFLVDAFREIDYCLDIYCYESMLNTDNLPRNIRVHFINPDKLTHFYTAIKTKNALAVIVPLNKAGLKYCTGHTSIVEAMALSVPVIVTDNPYHPIDVEKEGIGFKYKYGNRKSFLHALCAMASESEKAREMGQRGRILAEKRYNIDLCAQQLLDYFQME